MSQSYAFITSLFLACAILLFAAKWIYDTVLTPFRIIRECKKQGIPAAPFLPVIGQLPALRQAMKVGLSPTRSGEDDAKFFRVWSTWAAEYGSVYAVCFGSSPRLVVTDVKLIKELLRAPPHVFPKTPTQRLNLFFLGNGLVNSGGSFWQRQRKLVNPAFSHTNIKKMMDGMIESAEEAVADLKKKVLHSDRSTEVDMSSALSHLTLDIIGRAAFGANIGGGSEDAKKVSIALTRLLDCVLKVAVGGYRLIPFYSLMPTRLNRQMAASEREIKRLTLGMIEKRRQARAAGVEGSDLLSSMLAAVDDDTNEGMTDEQLMDECVTFLLAGHETTAQLLTWTMYLLALHPEWQHRLREEAAGGAMGADHVSALPLQHCALLESLRLFPPVPAMVRHVPNRTQLGPYSLPAGVGVHIPIGMLHFDKEAWGEDADKFRPERFKDGISAACTDPTSFLPFSAGPRICIGQAFALVEAKVILSRMLNGFEWTLSPAYVHSMQVFLTLRPAKGMFLNMKRLES